MALTLLLLNSDVVAVTVTYGESTTHIGALNMKRVCHTLKPLKKIPVAYGINSPIDSHFGTPFPEFINKEADNILKDTDVVPVAHSEITRSAVELIYKTLMSSDERTTIVATGPLTNIAQLVITYPDCIEKIEKLVIMGGAVKVPGNISDLIQDTTNVVAEWNIYADRKAADVVFTSKNLPIMLVPIDITRQMPMTKTFYEGLACEKLPALKLVRDMLTSLLKGMGEQLFYDKLQFWDSLSAMITLDNSIAEFEELPLTIDLSTGQTKINEHQIAGVPLVCIAMKLINPSSAYDLFKTLMKTSLDQNIKQVPIGMLLRERFFAYNSSTITTEQIVYPVVRAKL
jgi:inosine-uridine nucleoside N-ribohydrolase